MNCIARQSMKCREACQAKVWIVSGTGRHFKSKYELQRGMAGQTCRCALSLPQTLYAPNIELLRCIYFLRIFLASELWYLASRHPNSVCKRLHIFAPIRWAYYQHIGLVCKLDLALRHMLLLLNPPIHFYSEVKTAMIDSHFQNSLLLTQTKDDV